uniref:Intraflagellar transport particle protein IFT88 n=1 Tax=Chlamydomonas reinhardtii TaxID=3055 RepID=Q9FPW0_CHLRE|nr:intraflagellar transport particle protein IFT88 [Chlamydomonas reinhardtii]
MSYGGTEEDDLYGGYDEQSNPLAGSGGAAFKALGADGAPPGTAMMGPPGTAMKSFVPGTAMRGGTAMQQDPSLARPMTSNRGAGFTSAPNKKFDPLNRSMGSTLGSSGGGAMLVARKGDTSPEEQARGMEKTVHELLEKSAADAAKNDINSALENAMEAKKNERKLCRFREQNNMADQINLELMYAVDFNLAHMYHMNKNYSEALNLYTAIVRNKNFPQSGWLRVNMGNIHFEQKKYPSAIKMYRMALDQISATAKEVRFKIMRNIGLSFVRMGQYPDALQSFATVMDNVPDHQTGYNLVMCNYALSDREGMKNAFIKLLKVSPSSEMDDDDDDDPMGDDDMQVMTMDDGLKDEMRKRNTIITRLIVKAAQLISEKVDRANGFEGGFMWCCEQLRDAGYTKLANEVELAKATRFMGQKQFDKAVGVFKDFEKKEPRVKARAATNLAFLYFLEGETDQADKYSEMALKSDRYNARAYVNKGCVLVERGDLEGARSLFNEAAGIDPYCVEAIYNLGLVSQRLNELPYALAAFKKLHNMVPDNVEVIHQIATTYDMMGDFKNAVKWFELLTSLVSNDPGVLARLGAIHARFDDEAKALHYYQESHRVYPVNMDVISWLGAYHVKSEVYEKAMPFFDLASKIQPQEVKWALMVASCYRRTNNLPAALGKYKQIHTQHPDNVECLRYLVHLCSELGRRAEAAEYMTKLKKAEKAAVPEATTAAAPAAAAAGSGMGGMGGLDDDIGSSAVSAQNRGKKMLVKEHMGGGGGKDNDDWGNEQLGDDLLPM